MECSAYEFNSQLQLAWIYVLINHCLPSLLHFLRYTPCCLAWSLFPTLLLKLELNSFVMKDGVLRSNEQRGGSDTNKASCGLGREMAALPTYNAKILQPSSSSHRNHDDLNSLQVSNTSPSI